MADLIGQQLGNYRLTRLLGRGGFGEAYLGQHLRLNMQSAIKVQRLHLADQDIETFNAEAQTIASLVHPHIVRVLDFDAKDGLPFLVMDYAPNGSLRQRHPRGTRLPLPLVVSYVTQVADALQYAHDQRLIHRDVKPDNMLLGRRHEVVLTDFGIATIAHHTSSQSTQAMAGTVPYMAPEQVQGKPRLASDQYALGIVVYEWLSGSRPFDGTATEIAMQHVLTPPPPLSEKLPSIVREVEQVVLTALEKDPRQRFGSVQAFATALEQASQTAPSRPVVMPTQEPLPQEPSQPTHEERTTPPNQQPLLTPVITPPSQLAMPTESATSPSQSGEPPVGAVSFSPHVGMPPITEQPPGGEPVSAIEEERAAAPNQKLLPTEPVALPRSLGEPTVPASPPGQLLEPTIPAHSSSSALVLPPSQWREIDSESSGLPQPFKHRLSRRTVIGGLAGLAGLATVGSGMWWVVSQHPHPPYTYRSTTSNVSMAGPIDMNTLMTNAKKEGTLEAIGIPPEWADYADILSGYTSLYGVNIAYQAEAQYSSAQELEVFKKSQQQAHGDIGDVSFKFGPQAVQQDLVTPYKHAHWDDIPAELKDTNGNWCTEYYGAQAFVISTDIVKNLPASFKDLLNNDYKNMVGIDGDPRQANDAFLAVYSAALAQSGSLDSIQPGIDFFAQLKKKGNFTIARSSDANMAKGEVAIAIMWDYLGLGFRDTFKGKPNLKVVIPSDGSIAGPYVSIVNKTAPHPFAARLWMEYIFSDEGQLFYLKGYTHPARYNALVQANKIPAALASKLPPAAQYANVKFVTDLNKLTTGANLLNQNWGSQVLGS